MIPAILILLFAAGVAAIFVFVKISRVQAPAPSRPLFPPANTLPQANALEAFPESERGPQLEYEAEQGRGPMAPPEPGAFVVKQSLLSAAERTFLYAVAQALPPNTQIFVQVAYAAILQPRPGSKTWSRDRNRIGQKIADFVLCDQWCQPLAVIELDDSSHKRKARADRDELLDSILHNAGLPLLHYSAAGQYDIASLQAQLHSIIAAAPASR